MDGAPTPVEEIIRSDDQLVAKLHVQGFTLKNMGLKYVSDMEWQLEFQGVKWIVYLNVPMYEKKSMNTRAMVGLKVINTDMNLNIDMLTFEVSWDIFTAPSSRSSSRADADTELDFEDGEEEDGDDENEEVETYENTSIRVTSSSLKNIDNKAADHSNGNSNSNSNVNATPVNNNKSPHSSSLDNLSRSLGSVSIHDRVINGSNTNSSSNHRPHSTGASGGVVRDNNNSSNTIEQSGLSLHRSASDHVPLGKRNSSPASSGSSNMDFSSGYTTTAASTVATAAAPPHPTPISRSRSSNGMRRPKPKEKQEQNVPIVSSAPSVLHIEPEDNYQVEFTNEEFNFEEYLDNGLIVKLCIQKV